MFGAMARRVLPFSAVLALFLAPIAARAEGGARIDEAEAARLLHVIAYVAADYPRAVSDGKVVSRFEHDEHLALLAVARSAAKAIAIAEPARGASIPSALDELRARVAEAAPPREIEERADALERAVEAALRLDRSPHEMPNRARGRALFNELCATCHGPRGRGDGPRAAELKPPPVSFIDPVTAEGLSPLRVASAVRFGVEGTPMAAFPSLTERDRWDLGFYVLSLRHTPRASPRGACFAPIELARRSDGDLLDELFAAGAEPHELHTMIAELRSRSAFGEGPKTPFAAVRERLVRADQRDGFGDREEALRLVRAATRAFLGGVSPRLRAAAPDLDQELRERLLARREQVSDAGERARRARVLLRRLTTAELTLAGPAPMGDAKHGIAAGPRASEPVAWHRRAIDAMERGWVVATLMGAAIMAPPHTWQRRIATALAIVVGPIVVWSLWASGAIDGVAMASLVVLITVLMGVGAMTARRWPKRSRLVAWLGLAAALAALIGKAVFAATLAGVLPVHLRSWVGRPSMGVYPTIEAIAAQIAVILLATTAALKQRSRAGEGGRRTGG